MKTATIRYFTFAFLLLVACDTLPSSYKLLSGPKNWAHHVMACVGLAQGDWPLFAPNPVLNNSIIVAEVTDRDGNPATWSSTDWSRASVWTKFTRFRHLNYLQRIPSRIPASEDFAAYLLRSIPTKEPAQGLVRWSASNEMLPPAEVAAPVREIRLYQYRNTLLTSDENAYPIWSETPWSTQINYISRRDSKP